MNTNKTLYIAHPYTRNIKKNLKKVIKIANEYLDKGYVIFSPITHSHPIDKKKYREPEFWYKQDLRLLELFDCILMCPGWENSKGCMMELTKARTFGLKIIYYEDD